MRRGIGFHTVVSTGNQAVLDAGDWIEAVAALDGVRSIALFLEEDGDGAGLARALARCAEREIGVAVLKVGSSEAGARAAGAHTGARRRRPARLLRPARGGGRRRGPRPAGAAGAGAVPGRSRGRGRAADGGVAVLTCSGGDSGLAADLAEREGLAAARAGAGDPDGPGRAAARRRRPSAIPLDYTSMLWDEPETLARVAEAVGSDPGSASCCCSSTSREGLSIPARAGWERCAAPWSPGAERAGADPLLASTVPDLLPRAQRARARRARHRGAGRPERGDPLRQRPSRPPPLAPAPARDRRGGGTPSRRRRRRLARRGREQGPARRGRDPGAAVRRRRRRRRRRRPRRRARRPGRDQALGRGAAAQERGRGAGPRPRGGRRGPRRL